jgi:hypothetical protein
MTERAAHPSGASVGDAPPFPFFVGCARSGTTLLRSFFTAHPQMAIPDEAHYVMQMLTKRDRYERKDGFATEVFLRDLLGHKLFPFWVLPRETVVESFRSEPPASYADAVRRVFLLYAKQGGKPRYADKSPRNVLNLPPLAETFPEALFIHIIRDGRDVALSLLEMPWARPENVIQAARYWRRRVQRGRMAGRALGRARYLEVRYEALLENPEEIVRSICQFIDLPFDSAMLRYYEHEDLFDQRSKPPSTIKAKGSKTPPKVWTREGRHQKPPTKGLRDWRTQMSKKDVALFEVAAGDLLDELGYERGAARMATWTRIDARLRAVGSDARFAARRLTRRRTFDPEPPNA